MSNGQWRAGVSPEDIEARFYVRWLTKTKKEIYHYTNQGLLSTSCAWDASAPGIDATTNTMLHWQWRMEEWTNGDR